MSERKEEIIVASWQQYGKGSNKCLQFQKGAEWSDENPKNPWRSIAKDGARRKTCWLSCSWTASIMCASTCIKKMNGGCAMAT